MDLMNAYKKKKKIREEKNEIRERNIEIWASSNPYGLEVPRPSIKDTTLSFYSNPQYRVLEIAFTFFFFFSFGRENLLKGKKQVV